MIAGTSSLTIEEELFCTRYELEILSGIVNLNMLERWVPGFCNAHTHKEHISRYEWVNNFVKNKTVLDFACGSGFGSFKIASEGNPLSVTACDIDAKTIKYASCRNRHTLIDFQVQNAEDFSFNKKFDVVISFETIEHLQKPEKFLNNVKQVLDSKGDFFISTPISSVEQNNNPENMYHSIEWGFESFQKIISTVFDIKNIFLQVYFNPQIKKRSTAGRILNKTGIIKNEVKQVSRLDPFRWNPDEINKDMLGKTWIGYQIIHCKKK